MRHWSQVREDAGDYLGECLAVDKGIGVLLEELEALRKELAQLRAGTGRLRVTSAHDKIGSNGSPTLATIARFTTCIHEFQESRPNSHAKSAAARSCRLG